MSDQIKLGVAAGIVLIMAAWNIHGGGIAGGSPERAQQKLQSQAELALASVRADWARVEMTGQRADLAAPGRADIDVLIARGAIQHAAWNGGWLMGGVTKVRSDEARVWLPREGPYPWRAELDLSQVKLTGAAPTREMADDLAALAGALFTDRRVVNNLSIDPLPPAEGWEEAARGALAVLSHLDVGRATLADFELTVSGEAKTEDEAEAARAALSRLSGIVSATSQADVAAYEPVRPAPAAVRPDRRPAPGRDDRATPAAVDAASSPRLTEGPGAECQARLDAALVPGALLFEVGSVALSPESDPLIQELAEIAMTCSAFELHIEGHTDDTGVPALNQSLSERRAIAVLDRLTELGVETTRMTAVGLGATRPVGENSTPDGRRANRRIEIIVGP